MGCHVRAGIPPQRKILCHHAPAAANLGAKQPANETGPDINRTKTGAVSDIPMF